MFPCESQSRAKTVPSRPIYILDFFVTNVLSLMSYSECTIVCTIYIINNNKSLNLADVCLNGFKRLLGPEQICRQRLQRKFTNSKELSNEQADERQYKAYSAILIFPVLKNTYKMKHENHNTLKIGPIHAEYKTRNIKHSRVHTRN